VERLLRLEDGAARDPVVAGAKAAGLARALAAGLPVLPGWVLPVEHGMSALRAGLDRLERSGPAAARLAIVEPPPDPGLRRDLATLGRLVERGAIVRSSATVEDDPRWAGAFASYLEVVPGDLDTAVRGCWSSVFTRDVLARCAAIGVPPGELGIAVLIQPWVPFEGGGTARPDEDGTVRVSAVRGRPSALLAGRAAATTATVDADGRGEGEVELAGLGRTTLFAVAELVRRCRRAIGGGSIEWGVAGERVHLLQVGARAADRVPGPALLARQRPRDTLPEAAERLAALAVRYGGPVGDRVALPWALALPELATARAAAVTEPAGALGEVRALTAELTARAWGAPPDVAGREAAETLRSVLGPDPAAGLARLSGLRPVDPAAGSKVLALVEGIGRALADRGALAWPERVWRISLEELERAVQGIVPPDRAGPGRWDPFVFAVVVSRGRERRGRAAAPGIGVGPLRVLDRPAAIAGYGRRGVLAVGEPAPRIAPLLWRAGALVTAGGGLGAHLFEVARSLGVPAVTGVDLRGVPADTLVAVDGDVGTVHVLEPRARPERGPNERSLVGIAWGGRGGTG